jgi:hypothetical protein
MKNTSKIIALAIVGMAVSAVSAQRVNGNPLAPNANRATDGKNQAQNVQVNPNKAAASTNGTTSNTSVTQPDKNAGSVSKPQTLNANDAPNTSLTNPKNNGAGQPQTINANSNTNSARVNNVNNPGQSSNLPGNVAKPNAPSGLKLKPSNAVKTQNAGPAQTSGSSTSGN